MLRLLIIILLTFSTNSYSSDEYFLTLRNNEVNLRLGPSFEYPIKIIYQKKYLPVLIQDKLDNFRKVRDHDNNTGWIHLSQLSKKKAAITVIDETILFNRPTIYSKPQAKILKEVCIISKCKEEWCKIKTGSYKGWIKKALWEDWESNYFDNFDAQNLTSKKVPNCVG